MRQERTPGRRCLRPAHPGSMQGQSGVCQPSGKVAVAVEYHHVHTCSLQRWDLPAVLGRVNQNPHFLRVSTDTPNRRPDDLQPAIAQILHLHFWDDAFTFFAALTRRSTTWDASPAATNRAVGTVLRSSCSLVMCSTRLTVSRTPARSSSSPAAPGTARPPRPCRSSPAGPATWSRR
jgi:hypothetical protein